MHTIAHLIHAYGLIVVGGIIGLECMGFPVPGETALIIASAIAGRQHPQLNIVAVILTAAGATVVGRMVGYFIGARFGYWLLLRYGGYVRITETRIKLGQYLFLRHGRGIIVVAQFVPVLRTIAGILAGANRMPWRQFLAANIVGGVVWASFFGIAAYFLGREVERLAWSILIVCGLAAAVILIIAASFMSRHEAELAARAERAFPGPLRSP